MGGDEFCNTLSWHQRERHEMHGPSRAAE